MAVVKLVTDAEAHPIAKEVFDDIRATRKTDYVNNAWRAQANHPELLKRNWEHAKATMAPGALDAVTKELVYLAVSIGNSCEYCIHTHTHFARQKGLTDAQYTEFLAVLALAHENNRLMTAMQVPVDERFQVKS